MYEQLLRDCDGDSSARAQAIRDKALQQSFESHYRLASMNHQLVTNEVGWRFMSIPAIFQWNTIASDTLPAASKLRQRNIRTKARVAHVQYAQAMSVYMRMRHLWSLASSRSALRSQMERVALFERSLHELPPLSASTVAVHMRTTQDTLYAMVVHCLPIFEFVAATTAAESSDINYISQLFVARLQDLCKSMVKMCTMVGQGTT